MADPLNLHPRGGGIDGGEIGIDGSLVKIRPDKIIPRFVQPVIESSRYAQRYPSFLAGRLVYGSFTIKGIYKDGPQRDAVAVMVEGAELSNVQVKLGTGRSYIGNVIVRKATPIWEDDGKEKTVPYEIECQFSGRITLSSQSFSFPSESGLITDLRTQSVTLGYQDERSDLLVRPYIIHGVDEESTDPYDALGIVIGQLGGVGHTWHGRSLLRATASSAGYGIVTGRLEYGFGPWDCSPAAPIISIGFVNDIRREESGDFFESGENAELCDSFPITIVPATRRRVPIRVYRWPAVWDAEPEPGPVGYINNATYSFPNGTEVPMGCLRWDEAHARARRANGTTKYSGYVQFSRKDNGWIRGRIICIRSVPVAGPSPGLLPSYVLMSGFKYVYAYGRVAFPTLETYVPNCYG